MYIWIYGYIGTDSSAIFCDVLVTWVLIDWKFFFGSSHNHCHCTYTNFEFIFQRMRTIRHYNKQSNDDWNFAHHTLSLYSLALLWHDPLLAAISLAASQVQRTSLGTSFSRFVFSINLILNIIVIIIIIISRICCALVCEFASALGAIHLLGNCRLMAENRKCFSFGG